MIKIGTKEINDFGYETKFMVNFSIYKLVLVFVNFIEFVSKKSRVLLANLSTLSKCLKTL